MFKFPKPKAKGLLSALLMSSAVLMVFNQVQLSAMRAYMNMPSMLSMMQNTFESSGTKTVKLTGDMLTDAKNLVILVGIPEAYGAELNVEYDKPVQAIDVLESYDRGANKIELEGSALERYIRIALQASCEYCCSATTLVFDDGKSACGCAHSAAMRGLVAYLVTNHPDMTDDEILTEANVWKAQFFPKQSIQKVMASMEETGELDAGALNEMPSMVGGC